MSQRELDRAERIRIRFKERYAAATSQRERVAAAMDFLRAAAAFGVHRNPETVASFVGDAIVATVSAADSILALTTPTTPKRRA